MNNLAGELGHHLVPRDTKHLLFPRKIRWSWSTTSDSKWSDYLSHKKLSLGDEIFSFLGWYPHCWWLLSQSLGIIRNSDSHSQAYVPYRCSQFLWRFFFFKFRFVGDLSEFQYIKISVQHLFLPIPVGWWLYGTILPIIIWLVVWNIWIIFPYIGNNNHNWRTHIFWRCWNHQPVIHDGKEPSLGGHWNHLCPGRRWRHRQWLHRHGRAAGSQIRWVLGVISQGKRGTEIGEIHGFSMDFPMDFPCPHIFIFNPFTIYWLFIYKPFRVHVLFIIYQSIVIHSPL